jgi:hypothetical protein
MPYPQEAVAVTTPPGASRPVTETSGVAATIAVSGWTLALERIQRSHPVASVKEYLEEGRRLDLASTEGRFRLGDITEALRRELPAVADVLDRLAIDLEVDRDTITEAWFVATAFPPATRRPVLPWATYLILRFHPERHELVDRAASAGWNQARIQEELSAHFTAHHRSPPDQSA